MSEDIRIAPLNDGSEEDCQCARCGSSVHFVDCWGCGGEGEVERDEWDFCGTYFASCSDCRGSGGWYTCLSDAEWCEANPIVGRESIERGKIEWFSIPSTIEPPNAVPDTAPVSASLPEDQ